MPRSLSSALIYQTHFPLQSETNFMAFQRKRAIINRLHAAEVYSVFFISSR